MFHDAIIRGNSINKEYLENFFDAYLIMERNGVISDFSDSVLKLFNKNAEHIQNRHVSVLFPDEQEALNESFKNREYEFNNGDRKVSLFRTRSAFGNEEDDSVRIIEGMLDITNCKKMNELKMNMKIEQMKHDRDRNGFLNWKEMYGSKDQRVLDSIIYALNNTLNSMGGTMMLDYIKQHMQVNPDGHHIDNAGYEVLDELIKILYPLLDNIANLENLLQKGVELSEIPLGECIGYIGKCAANFNAARAMEENRIRLIHVPCNYGEATIRINRKYIEEIMSELLTNAFKYSRPDENIWIDIDLYGSILKCKITNIPVGYRMHGREITGIPYEYTEKVFNPFERLNWNISGKHHEDWGFGLGLFAVRKMIEKMNGKIECYNSIYYNRHEQSKPITTFCISLPFDKNNLNVA